MTANSRLESALGRISTFEPVVAKGEIARITGLLIEALLPDLPVGSLCRLHDRQGEIIGRAEVIGFSERYTRLMPLDHVKGLGPGFPVTAESRPLDIPVGEQLLGRVLDGTCKPIDGKGPLGAAEYRTLDAKPVNPIDRGRISKPISTGIRCIDSLLTIGNGQRFGIFSGSGVGKSMLLGMIARHTSADVNVVALIGERSREVNEFLDKNLGPEGLAKSVVIVVTSGEPAIRKIKGALAATTVAEHFRDRGDNVMLMLDSLTRIAMAQREIGLAGGEPPTTRGYTPSVFDLLQKLLERAGLTGSGSITGAYTVLVEGDDFNEPVSDTVRSILDGHVILARKLANRGCYPAIDVLESISRVMTDIVDDAHLKAAHRFRELTALYEDTEDLITIGAYRKGQNPDVDRAVSKRTEMVRFINQSVNEPSDYKSGRENLLKLTGGVQDETVQIQAGYSAEI